MTTRPSTYAEYRRRPVWITHLEMLAMPDLPHALREAHERFEAERVERLRQRAERRRARRQPLPKCDACGRLIFPFEKETGHAR